MWELKSTLRSKIGDFGVGAEKYPCGQKLAILISELTSTLWSKIGDFDVGAKGYSLIKNGRF